MKIVITGSLLSLLLQFTFGYENTSGEEHEVSHNQLKFDHDQKNDFVTQADDYEGELLS